MLCLATKCQRFCNKDLSQGIVSAFACYVTPWDLTPARSGRYKIPLFSKSRNAPLAAGKRKVLIGRIPILVRTLLRAELQAPNYRQRWNSAHISPTESSMSEKLIQWHKANLEPQQHFRNVIAGVVRRS